MTVYFTVQAKVKDHEAYARYSESFLAIFSKFKGTILSADFNPKVYAGEWAYEHLVIMSFPDEAALHEWLESKEYTAISEDRDQGTDSIALISQGLDAVI